MYNKKKMPKIVLFVIIIGILLSGYLIVSSFLFSNSKSFLISSDVEVDAGYVNLIRNPDTPSAFEFVRFKNNETFMFFSLSNNEVLRERVYLDDNNLDGRKLVDYEIVYLSGESDAGTFIFR